MSFCKKRLRERNQKANINTAPPYFKGCFLIGKHLCNYSKKHNYSIKHRRFFFKHFLIFFKIWFPCFTKINCRTILKIEISLINRSSLNVLLLSQCANVAQTTIYKQEEYKCFLSQNVNSVLKRQIRNPWSLHYNLQLFF